MGRSWICSLLLLTLAGCGTFFSPGGTVGSTQPSNLPSSQGEFESGYTYVPVDPFPVESIAGASCKDTGPIENYTDLLESLPDNAVRMLVERFDLSGNVSYGVAKTGAKGESYRITIDYINADTINVQMWIGKRMRDRTGTVVPVSILDPSPVGFAPGSEIYELSRIKPAPFTADQPPPTMAEFNIPVYVGVGLRVSANVYVVGANANISGIGVIGAEAEAEKVKGSLVVQTLGVNGKSVAAALPIQSELNRTTAQNAIVSVGAIKALLYAEETIKSPRVVGLYLPFPGGKPLVNAIISELSKKRVEWPRPCLPAKKKA